MAHTKPSDLRDITELLEELAALPGLTQRKPGIFYRKSGGFLHFHDKDGLRWADVKTSAGWQKVEVPFNPSRAACARLLRAAKSALGEK